MVMTVDVRRSLFLDRAVIVPTTLVLLLALVSTPTLGVDGASSEPARSPKADHPMPTPSLSGISGPDAARGGCVPIGHESLIIPLDGTWSVVPFGGGIEDESCFGTADPEDPCQRCDDDYSSALPLGFTFDLYGSPETSVHINNNGNLTFGGGLCQFITSGFPNAEHTIVAPFWADVDTRVPNTGAGVVYYKQGPGYFAVTWDHVGHYLFETERQNTFQVVLTDGTSPILGVGNNVGFSYGEMNWTTGDPTTDPGNGNGFGNPPATVGVNKGDGIDFFQIGRFDRPGTDYDGPVGSGDGVDWLEGQQFFSYVGEQNTPPVPVDFPSAPIVVRIGEPFERSVGFIGPENGETVTVTVDDGGLANFSYVSTPGNPAMVDMYFTPAVGQAGDHEITFQATDDNVLPGVTDVSLTLRVPPPGPNAGGVLLVHTDDNIAYTSDGDYVGASGLGCPEDFSCPPYEGYAGCIHSIGLANPTSGRGTDPTVWWVLAAFPPSADTCPRLSAVSFGIDYDGGKGFPVIDEGMAGDFEIPTSSWPLPGEGTAVTWQQPRRTQIAEVYWFAGYVYYGAQEFRVGPHPTQGGFFADDAVPSNLDTISGYGTLGLNGATGSNPFPGGGVTGACCLPAGDCLILDAPSCAVIGGSYAGDGVPCTPELCAPPTGACCAPDASCSILSELDCSDGGSDYQGDDTTCDPHPCAEWYARGSFYGSGIADGGNALNDDGLNGDAAPGDGVYSGFVTADVGPGFPTFRIGRSDGSPAYPTSPVALAITQAEQDVFFRLDTNEFEDDWFPSGNVVWSDAVRPGSNWSVVGDLAELGSGDPSATSPAVLRNGAWRSPVWFSGPTSGSYIWTADGVFTVQQVGADGYGTSPLPVSLSVPAEGWVLFEYDPGVGRIRHRSGIVGACCLDEETCEIVTANICTSLGGEFFGIDTTCEPSPCVQPVLAVAPDSLGFGSTETALDFTIENIGTGMLTWSAEATTESGGEWLGLDPTGGTHLAGDDPSPVSVMVDRGELAPGDYAGSVLVTSDGGDTTIAVTMTIDEEPLLAVDPDSLGFGSFDTTLDFTIENVGTGTLTWSAEASTESGGEWLGLDPLGGTHLAGDLPSPVTVTVDRGELPPGDYVGSVLVASDGGDTTIPVTMTVDEEPLLAVDPDSLGFGSTDTALDFTIENVGTGTLTWSAEASTESGGEWLSLDPLGGTHLAGELPSPVTVTVDRGELPPGDYAGSVLVTSDGGDTTIAVTMTIDEEPLLAVDPLLLEFGPTETALEFTVANAGTGTLTWFAEPSTGTGDEWLGLDPISGDVSSDDEPFAIVVTVERGELPPGDYEGSILVSSDGGEMTVDVTMTVPEAPLLSVAPLLLEFGSAGTQRVFEIQNTGTGTLDWSASATESWVQVAPASGETAGGTSGEIDRVTVTVSRAGLEPGDYDAIVAVFSDGGNESISVTMTVPEEPTLSVTPEELDFGSLGITSMFEVTNSGTGELSWTATPGAPWIDVDPVTGTTTTEADAVDVTVDRSGLEPGEYSANISLTSNGGDQTVLVRLTVDEMPELVVSETSLDFGSSTTQLPLEITNPGTGTLTWTATPSGDGISAEPTNGSTTTETDIVTVTVDRTGLGPGEYTGTVTLDSNGVPDGLTIGGAGLPSNGGAGGGAVATVDISFVVDEAPSLDVATTLLDLGTTGVSTTIDIRNSGTGTLTWAIGSSEDWLTAVPASGSTTNGVDEVTVLVSRSGLTPGDYSGSLEIESNGGTASIPVAMSVAAVPGLGLSVTALDFGSADSELTTELTNTGTGTLVWAAASDEPWIEVSPTSGTTTTETELLTVTVDRTGFSPGSYEGSVEVTSNGGDRVLTVVLVVPEVPALGVSLKFFDFGSENEQDSFQIRNTGTGTLEWTVGSDDAWITLDPSSGSTSTEIDVVTVEVSREGLAPGAYTGSATVQSNGGEELLEIRMTVPEAPVFDLSVDSVDFGTTLVESIVEITNIGTGTLEWTATRTEVWIEVSPGSGETTTEIDELLITVDRIGRSPGLYEGSVLFSSDAGDATIPVRMTIPEVPTLSLAPLSVDLGSDLDEAGLTIRNTGTGTLDWTIEVSAGWLTVNPLAGETTTAPDPITIEVDRTGLEPGEYVADVSVQSNGGTATAEVRMVVPEEPVLALEPTELAFGADGTEDVFNITNPGTGTLTWSISETEPWLTALPASGSTTDESDEITVTIDRTGLEPGDYSAVVTVISNGGAGLFGAEGGASADGTGDGMSSRTGAGMGTGTVNVTMTVAEILPEEGACCLDGDCVLRTEAVCVGSGGTYLGDGTECGPESCPDPVGACCTAAGACALATEADCADPDDVAWTEDAICDPNPCTAVFTRVLVAESQGGGFAWEIESDPTAGIEDLVAWYRTGGASTFEQIETADFSRNGSVWTTPFDAEERTPRGLEYYLSFRLPSTPPGLVQLFGSEDDPNRIAFTAELEVPPLEPFVVRMISAPAEVETGSVHELLTDLLGASGDQNWLMGRWNPAASSSRDANGYVMVTPSNPGAFVSGHAYWLGVAQAGVEWRLDGTTRFPRGEGNVFDLVLEPGWNMVGNPAAYPIGLGANALRIDAGTGSVPYRQAVGSEWVSQIYVHDPSLPTSDPNYPYRIDPPALDVWGGCWIRNRLDEDIRLLVPAVEAPVLLARGATGMDTGTDAGSGPDVAGPNPDSATDLGGASGKDGGSGMSAGSGLNAGVWDDTIWSLAFDVKSEGECERLEIGVARSRTDGVPLTAHTVPAGPRERLSSGLLPAGSLYGSGGAPSEAGGAPAAARFGETLRRDLRLSGATEFEWRLVVSNPDGPVRLGWSDAGSGSIGFAGTGRDANEWNLTLRHEATGRAWSLDQLHSIELPVGSHELVLRAVPGEVSQEPVTGLELYVDPNPFSRDTVLRYRLPARGDVQAQVYNAAGVRVWRREEGGREAGDHVILWDGRDQRGRTLPAGAYFLHLRAQWGSGVQSGGSEATRKIVIVR